MKCQIKSAFFPFTLHLAYNSIKIIERNPTLSDSFPCEQAFGCWRFFFFLLAVWWQRGGKSLQQSQAQEGLVVCHD